MISKTMDISNREPISVVMITYNEADNIENCLRSLEWADEIVVVDSHSTDGTADIARKYTERIIERDWPGFTVQRNFASDQAEHDWVLSIDADERVTPELKDAILDTLTNGGAGKSGFFIPIKTYYLGRWIRHCGWHHEKLRLYQRSKGKFVGQHVHEKLELEGPTGRLVQHIDHYNYRNVSEQIQRVDHYSALAAQEMFDNGRRFFLPSLFIRPPVKFLETYLWKLGILDGLPGLIISVMDAYQMFLRYAKLWEMGKK